jgi:radical SAM protein with 4Fe4S-binding SPASM domain
MKSKVINTGIGHTTKLFKDAVKYTASKHLGFPRVYPKSVRFSITNVCDSHCGFCGIWRYYKEHPERLKDEMTSDEFKKFVEVNSYLDFIGLSGGQPTLKKGIIDFWLVLDKFGFSTILNTNAVNLKRVKAVETEILSKLSGKTRHQLTPSVDGLGEVHNLMRSNPGEFDKLVSLVKWGLKMKKKYSFYDVTIGHNITPGNCHQLTEFVDFWIKVGLEPVEIALRTPDMLERFENKESEELVVVKGGYAKIIKAIKKLQAKYPFYKNNMLLNYAIKHLENPEQTLVVPCYATYSYCFIDPYWDVYACFDTRMEFKIGNMRDYDFSIKKMWDERQEVLKRIKKDVDIGRCSGCWNNCMGGFNITSNPIELSKFTIEQIKKKMR